MGPTSKVKFDKDHPIVPTLKMIYKDYWSKPISESSVYSSHWNKFISMNAVDLSEAEDQLKVSFNTKGFGSYIPNSAGRKVLDVPRQSLLKRLMIDLDEKNVRAMSKILKSMGVLCSFDAVKQVKAIECIKNEIDFGSKKIGIIGDGFG